MSGQIFTNFMNLRKIWKLFQNLRTYQ